ncbi:hypothetical protein MNEG_12338 [Monoraphidium neglectum]|uniref:Glutamine amidotransferase type-2 domain-containing protein n=1 Tax=Monoraphidium neglectum TaxID=145388 RepID=A0A0D2MLA3_9CHLO|nr:hypothetical protein MNEG_12338 [Monoraphidium neglectum]KIY95625.1 hypothetical protein MNEG_12338 [Monoraphidium neglectum]|eukprot:XP_013894645.1 hypothetical protein MNEG_12338 [Monoraphidium neglectum]
MCRLMAYIGHPMLVADVVLWPDRSIIKQSYDARERLQDPSLPFHLGFGNLNGDGFGIGWFNTEERREKDPSPCMFKSITPACLWADGRRFGPRAVLQHGSACRNAAVFAAAGVANEYEGPQLAAANNENLARLSTKIVSPVIFAHVRAAYPGMPVSEQNCHPFQFGRYLWMHNGVVGGFNCIRRHLLAEMSDAAYNTVQSFHSDSAVSFSIFLNHLPDPCVQQPPDVLLRAMQDTVATICRVQRERGVADTSLLNFVVSDGITMIATRFVSPESGNAASLYYAEGATGEEEAAVTTCRNIAGSTSAVGSSVLREAAYSITYGERGSGVAFIASEPITGSNTDWVSVPKNTALVITREKGGYINIMRSPLLAAPAAAGKPDPVQQEVAVCLEPAARRGAARRGAGLSLQHAAAAAVIRGIATRGRAWVAKRTSNSASGGGAGPLDAPGEGMSSLTRTLSAGGLKSW